MAPSELRPVGLKCEYRVDPLGIGERSPRLSWTLEAEGRGQAQSAYRILVAGNEEDLEAEENLLWDSGRVESGRYHRRRVRGRGAAVGLAVRVEGTCLGRGRRRLALQPSGRLRDGLAGEVGLGGNLDLRRQRSGRRPGAAIGRRVRRPGQRTRPEPLPAQGVPTGQTGPQGTDLRDGPRRLRTVRKREQGRRTMCSPLAGRTTTGASSTRPTTSHRCSRRVRTPSAPSSATAGSQDSSVSTPSTGAPSTERARSF